MSIISNWIGCGNQGTRRHLVVSVYVSELKGGTMQGSIIFREDVLAAQEVGEMYGNLLGYGGIVVEDGAKVRVDFVLPGYTFVNPKNTNEKTSEFISIVSINDPTGDVPFWFEQNDDLSLCGMEKADIDRRMGQVSLYLQNSGERLNSFNLWDYGAGKFPKPTLKRKLEDDPCSITGKHQRFKRMREEIIELEEIRVIRRIKIKKSGIHNPIRQTTGFWSQFKFWHF